MKSKIYNYRNTTNINATLLKAPVGIRYGDYPLINKKRKELDKTLFDKTDEWFSDNFYEYDVEYHINVLFKERVLLFKPNGIKYSNPIPYTTTYYYEVSTDKIGTKTTFPDCFWSYNNGEINSKGKRKLVPVRYRVLDFKIPLKNIKLMEVKTSFWSSVIKLKLILNRKYLNNIEDINIHFHKDDEKDAEFLIKEIDSLRRSIQAEEHSEIMKRWEENDK